MISLRRIILILKIKNCSQVVLVKTEDSILRSILEHLQYRTNTNNQSVKEVRKDDCQSVERTEREGDNGKENQKAILQKQVETGEITPFEAVLKQSASESAKGYNVVATIRLVFLVYINSIYIELSING